MIPASFTTRKWDRTHLSTIFHHIGVDPIHGTMLNSFGRRQPTSTLHVSRSRPGTNTAPQWGGTILVGLDES